MKVKDMDLLDYFASQAIACTPDSDFYFSGEEAEKVAKSAYNIAEAMLKEREKRRLI